MKEVLIEIKEERKPALRKFDSSNHVKIELQY